MKQPPPRTLDLFTSAACALCDNWRTCRLVDAAVICRECEEIVFAAWRARNAAEDAS